MVYDRFWNRHLYTPLGVALASRELFTLQLTVIFSQWSAAQSIKYDHKTLLTPCIHQRNR